MVIGRWTSGSNTIRVEKEEEESKKRQQQDDAIGGRRHNERRHVCLHFYAHQLTYRSFLEHLWWRHQFMPALPAEVDVDVSLSCVRDDGHSDVTSLDTEQFDDVNGQWPQGHELRHADVCWWVHQYSNVGFTLAGCMHSNQWRHQYCAFMPKVSGGSSRSGPIFWKVPEKILGKKAS